MHNEQHPVMTLGVCLCVSGLLGYEDRAERHQKERLLCVLGNRRQNHPHGAE